LAESSAIIITFFYSRDRKNKKGNGNSEELKGRTYLEVADDLAGYNAILKTALSHAP
jgi:hypothetical protein